MIQIILLLSVLQIIHNVMMLLMTQLVGRILHIRCITTELAQKQTIGKRGAVIFRSTFPSSGSYVGHWLSENHATWDDLKFFHRADICGFEQATTEELCLRWQQLGAFYPFMRNLNDNGQPAQNPGVWPSVAEATRKSNLFHYRHLPYLYTLLFNASLNEDTARPVFFKFPNDTATYELSMQFMWGPALIVVTVTDQFVAVMTTLSRQNPFQLLVALASTRSNGQTHHLAYGEPYWDDGETVVDNINTYNYYHFKYSFSTNTDIANLTISRTKQATGITLSTLDNIKVFSLTYAPNFSTAKLNGSPITINSATSSYSYTSFKYYNNKCHKFEQQRPNLDVELE